jgi:hypothetical protein
MNPPGAPAQTVGFTNNGLWQTSTNPTASASRTAYANGNGHTNENTDGSPESNPNECSIANSDVHGYANGNANGNSEGFMEGIRNRNGNANRTANGIENGNGEGNLSGIRNLNMNLNPSSARPNNYYSSSTRNRSGNASCPNARFSRQPRVHVMRAGKTQDSSVTGAAIPPHAESKEASLKDLITARVHNAFWVLNLPSTAKLKTLAGHLRSSLSLRENAYLSVHLLAPQRDPRQHVGAALIFADIALTPTACAARVNGTVFLRKVISALPVGHPATTVLVYRNFAPSMDAAAVRKLFACDRVHKPPIPAWLFVPRSLDAVVDALRLQGQTTVENGKTYVSRVLHAEVDSGVKLLMRDDPILHTELGIRLPDSSSVAVGSKRARSATPEPADSGSTRSSSSSSTPNSSTSSNSSDSSTSSKSTSSSDSSSSSDSDDGDDTPLNELRPKRKMTKQNGMPDNQRAIVKTERNSDGERSIECVPIKKTHRQIPTVWLDSDGEGRPGASNNAASKSGTPSPVEMSRTVPSAPSNHHDPDSAAFSSVQKGRLACGPGDDERLWKITLEGKGLNLVMDSVTGKWTVTGLGALEYEMLQS